MWTLSLLGRRRCGRDDGLLAMRTSELLLHGTRSDSQAQKKSTTNMLNGILPASMAQGNLTAALVASQR
jgi:hypothetical protein